MKQSLPNWETLEKLYRLGNIRSIAVIQLGKGMPTMSPQQKSVCNYACSMLINWVGTTLIIRVDDILLIYLRLNYFFRDPTLLEGSC